MKRRRLRLLLFSLFLLATVTSALHTIEHHHAADNCPVCTVAGHSAAPDVVAPVTSVELCFDDAPDNVSLLCRFRQSVHFTPSRAPPSTLRNT